MSNDTKEINAPERDDAEQQPEPTWPGLLSTRYASIDEVHAAWRERTGKAAL